jgi:hypothetical protein
MKAPMGDLSAEDVDAVIFDAGGVLVLPDAALGRAAIHALKADTGPED